MGIKKGFSSIVCEAIAVNARSSSWERIIGAALSMTIPILIGLFLGNIQYGLVASLGGFTYLYAFPIPYAHQSKRLLLIAIGIVFVSFLGSITAPYPLTAAITMGLIAAIVIFIFNALKFIGPSALFFVLIFALTANMPQVDLVGALGRAGLVALGASLSWLMAMSGFIINPHRPELQSMQRAYDQLIKLSNSVGTEKFQHEKYLSMVAFKEAKETLIEGELPWSPSVNYKRLRHLAVEGNEYLLFLGNNYADSMHPLPEGAMNFLKEVAVFLKSSLRHKLVGDIGATDTQLSQHLHNIKAAIDGPIEQFSEISYANHYSVKDILANAFDRNSLVFITAVRFGVITMVAALIAYYSGLMRSDWIPLSCVAVMSGATMVATFHRALQRSIGTVLGILIASIVLYFEPTEYQIVLLIFFFTLMTEFFIVKNYGLAVLFITPSALLLATTISQEHISLLHFSGVRIIDTIVGSVIGLIGVLLTSKHSASIRIPRILMRTLRSQSQTILLLFSKPRNSTPKQIKVRLIKLKVNLANLTALYDAAIGEIPKKQALIAYYWPIIYSMEKLTFLLSCATENSERAILSESDLARLLYLFETLANSVQFDESNTLINVPTIPGFYDIEQEIKTLQLSFVTITKQSLTI